LPGADSLRQAFGRASLEISKREQQEDVTPSKPQAFFGSQIDRVLLALDRRTPLASNSTGSVASRPALAGAPQQLLPSESAALAAGACRRWFSSK